MSARWPLTMLRALPCLVVALVATPVGWAAPAVAPSLPALVSTVQSRLNTSPVLRGQFEQSKRLSGFKKPLLSRGDFLVSRGQGVLWHTAQPFDSKLKLTREEITATQADGSVSFRLQAKTEPSVRLINRLLFALLSGDLQELAQQFSLRGESSAQGWSLELTPKDPAWAQVFNHIQISGDEFVRQIRLDEAGGDQTLIRFSQHSPAAKLNAAESHVFD